MGFKEMREKANMSQAEVAKVLGISQGAVANWESGFNNPTADKLVKVAALYRCTIDDLLKAPSKATGTDKNRKDAAV